MHMRNIFEEFDSSNNLSFLVIIHDRPFSYTKVDMDNVNVILNSNDVSEYLKISPNGLEVNNIML
jgi:hypothetical protein